MIIGIFIISILFIGPFFIFQTGWFGDDLIAIKYAKENYGKSLKDVFLYKNTSMRRYRPLTQAIIVKGYELLELDPILFRFLAYISFLTSISIACLLSNRIKMSNGAVFLGVVLFSVHQMIIQPLFRNGRPEPIILAFGLIALYFYDRLFIFDNTKKNTVVNRIAFCLLSSTALFLSLLSGELAFCFLFILPIWVLIRRLLASANQLDIKAILRNIVSVILIPLFVCLIYLSIYLSVGAPFSEKGGRYEVGIGFHIIKNILVAVAGLLSPVSTPFMAKAYYQNFSKLIISGLISSFIPISILILSYAILKNDTDKTYIKTNIFGISMLWTVCAMLSFFPFIIIGHVSEIYLYNATLFFCFGLGNFLYNAMKEKRSIHNFALMLTVILILFHSISSVHKYILIKNNADCFENICNQIESKCLSQSSNGPIYLYDSNPISFFYSQFYIPLNNLYYYGPQRNYAVNFIDKNESDKLITRGKVVWQVNRQGYITKYF
jgi:hypothetical protein